MELKNNSSSSQNKIRIILWRRKISNPQLLNCSKNNLFKRWPILQENMLFLQKTQSHYHIRISTLEGSFQGISVKKKLRLQILQGLPY